MRNSGSDFTVEYLRQKLDAVYCHERGTSVELSANSDKHYPMILFKRGRRVQAIIWFCDRMLDDTKLKNMRRQGSKVHEEMLLHNCRVVYVFTRKKPQNINYEYWAFNCVWVFIMIIRSCPTIGLAACCSHITCISTIRHSNNM